MYEIADDSTVVKGERTENTSYIKSQWISMKMTCGTHKVESENKHRCHRDTPGYSGRSAIERVAGEMPHTLEIPLHIETTCVADNDAVVPMDHQPWRASGETTEEVLW